MSGWIPGGWRGLSRWVEQWYTFSLETSSWDTLALRGKICYKALLRRREAQLRLQKSCFEWMKYYFCQGGSVILVWGIQCTLNLFFCVSMKLRIFYHPVLALASHIWYILHRLLTNMAHDYYLLHLNIFSLVFQTWTNVGWTLSYVNLVNVLTQLVNINVIVHSVILPQQTKRNKNSALVSSNQGFCVWDNWRKESFGRASRKSFWKIQPVHNVPPILSPIIVPTKTSVIKQMLQYYSFQGCTGFGIF